MSPAATMHGPLETNFSQKPSPTKICRALLAATGPKGGLSDVSGQQGTPGDCLQMVCTRSGGSGIGPNVQTP